MIPKGNFVVLILLASNTFSQNSNSTDPFTFLNVTNPPLDYESPIKDQAAIMEANKVKDRPKGVTLPDGTFIPNQPSKPTSAKKNESNIWRKFVESPELAAEMAEQGATIIQNALSSGAANVVVPLDNVRAMYAIAIFYRHGYHCGQNKEESLQWMIKAGLAGTLKINGGKSGGERAENDKISEQEILEATKSIEAEILVK